MLINLFSQIPDIKMYESVPTVFLPVMWFENSAEVPPELVFKMRLFSNLQVCWIFRDKKVGFFAPNNGTAVSHLWLDFLHPRLHQFSSRVFFN
jgi:hypothetical protein